MRHLKDTSLERDQAEGDDFNSFLAELRSLIKSCGYCVNCEPSILRDRIIRGIRNDDTREDLLKYGKKSIGICVVGEAAARQRSSLQSGKINKVNAAKKAKSGKCNLCAQEHVFVKDECPAWVKGAQSAAGTITSSCAARI